MPFLESFRAVRWLRTLNLVLQAILVVTLFGGLNYVAKNHAWRFDLTRQHKFSLSPETLSYIRNLQRPVHLILTATPESENADVRGLIDEYVYASEGRPQGRITKEVLDIYQNRRRSEELGIETPDVIVLVSGSNRTALRVDELYTLKNKQRDTFRGEQALTAGILNVSSTSRQKIYFVTGHGELRVDDPDPQRGLSALRDQLKIRNFDVEFFELAVNRRVPADASLVFIVAPQSGYSRAEQEMLRQYLGAGAGRVLMFLAPGKSAAALGLDELLLDWGVLVYNDVILDVGPENVTENLEIIIRAFDPHHPITKSLVEFGSQVLKIGMARTVVPDPGRSLGNGVHTTTVAATSTTAWGERGGQRPGEFPKYDPGIDTRALPGMEPPDRLGVIVASERLGVRDNLPFSVPGGKLVVFGTGDLVANGRIDNAPLLIVLNAVNWAVDRDPQLTIPPKPIERFQLTLSAADYTRLRYAVLLVLPGGALLLGLLVYWTRRA